ncbi:2-hydroxymuconic semialdehyde dehydrogenase [Achromobacter sp.]|uniref:2-hydroxymuconic semialdehyde dehydrogenase n=1 Tax=Achromobacter sp. TaxID=134375 RepID=UPI00258868FC|nr:2-hydroxymuconic semialdehyde dehydrogenase [Achromobacter sp.]
MTIRQLRNYIDGRFEDGASTFDKHSPVDHALIAQAHEASREQVDRAVAAAHRALPAWAALPVVQRTDHLLALADGINRRFDDFLQAEIGDTGKPVSWAGQIDIPRGAANFRAFAELARTLDMESYMTDTPDGRQALNYAYRKPLGVVGVISPWNLPLLLLTWKVAPALAFGNTVIMKPSEVTPSTATLLAEVAHDTGLPPGVLNLTHGFGPGSAGEFITTHPDIDGITFTGESATGAAIMRAVAPGVKPVSFELGGKNAALVFADADFEAAVDGTARSVFANCGQVCLCTERVYVQRPIYERFVAALAEHARALRIGWPDDADTGMGPLVSREHRDKVLSYFALAREEGATVVTGGGVPVFGDARDAGAYVQPTIWTGLPESARCIKEEVFGPVCHVAPFDTEEEAIRLANDTRYGLGASVWTTDAGEQERCVEEIEAGQVFVNAMVASTAEMPFGGIKRSGYGRELSALGIREFCNAKGVWIA